MIVLSHRGYWKAIEEKNTEISFKRSFDLGFGTETDLRDHDGEIVISHDMPVGDEMRFEQLLSIMDGRNLPLALNIKADGLSKIIKEILKKYNHTNYFTFDMSIPDMVCQINNKLNVFTGLSDILNQPVLIDDCCGVWLDCFNSDWYDHTQIDNLIKQGKKVCLVSADLHRRDVSKQWDMIRKSKYVTNENLMLCTDFPEVARGYFK
ncbi:phosphodiesterase [Gilliamella sp. Nev6-6]|uniref:phosphodiesterase n=1 Tax=unclassified Gilliamella TaxID=2685620 RepID=UPI00080E151C|nr:phosphodiesterase [Gilliamella apicola]OCG61279.1 phosphodiesterase [Gilliamella apicola]OCG67247.1 phosphodiesterase [Gilliamella apicola]OCG78321.1 phosphodiesterase [Gilliamella apicola]